MDGDRGDWYSGVLECFVKNFVVEMLHFFAVTHFFVSHLFLMHDDDVLESEFDFESEKFLMKFLFLLVSCKLDVAFGTSFPFLEHSRVEMAEIKILIKQGKRKIVRLQT